MFNRMTARMAARLGISQSKLTWVIASVLGTILAINLILTIIYMQTKKMPGIGGIANALGLTTAPRFLFSIYGASKPLGIAVTPDGQRIYVTEGDGERAVRVFDAKGNAVAFLTPPNSKPGGRQPFYVAVLDDGRILVTDRFDGRVWIYQADGKFEGELRAPADKWSPLGVNTAAGLVFVTEAGEDRHRVLVFDQQLQPKFEIGQRGGAPGEFSFPNGATADRDRIFVSNGNNNRVDVFDREGKLNTEYAQGGVVSGVGLPRGIALDDQKRLYVVDTTNAKIAVFNTGTKTMPLLFSFGDSGIGDGQFRYPNGVAIDAGGRIYVTDRENNRVQVWAY